MNKLQRARMRAHTHTVPIEKQMSLSYTANPINKNFKKIHHPKNLTKTPTNPINKKPKKQRLVPIAKSKKERDRDRK